jgi:LDH2 family malate/lactate/ureidoglycolate dehydrogenase
LRCVPQLRQGAIAADAVSRVVQRVPPLIRLNGDNGLGPAVGWWAVDQASQVAAGCGACVAVITNANHLGALGPYVERAAGRGAAAFVTQATPSVMAPYGGIDAVLGNVPMAIAVPGGDGDHPVLDMSGAGAAKAKTAEAAAEGRPIPPGWALSPSGQPATDATKAIARVQLPWGHKGGGLTVVLSLLSNVVAGNAGLPPKPGTRRLGPAGPMTWPCSWWSSTWVGSSNRPPTAPPSAGSWLQSCLPGRPIHATRCDCQASGSPPHAANGRDGVPAPNRVLAELRGLAG